MRRRIVALAGLVVVAVIAGACSGESTHVRAVNTPVAGVSVEARLRLDGDVLRIAYQVANRSPGAMLVTIDISRSYVRLGEDKVLEVGRALRPPIEGVTPIAVPRADMTTIPPGKSFGEELPLHWGRGPLDTVDGPTPATSIMGARFCVGLISDDKPRIYQRRGMIVTVFEDKETVAAQRAVCSDVVPLRVNAEGYLVPAR